MKLWAPLIIMAITCTTLMSGLFFISGEDVAAQKDHPSELLLLAASSTTELLTQLSEAYEAETGIQVKCSFASSAVLARQIEAGADADLYLSANNEWMDHLSEKKAIQSDTRVDILSNRLVLVKPASSSHTSTTEIPELSHSELIHLLTKEDGHLAIAESASVPLGIYSAQSLRSLGIYNETSPRFINASNARSTLKYLETGECSLGLVYLSDAQSSHQISILSLIPETLHSPIRYPVAALPGANVHARSFIQWVKQSPKAQAIIRESGFFPVVDDEKREE